MTACINGTETSRGRWSDAQFSFGAMVARASADARLRPGDLLGSGTVGTGCLLEVKDGTLGRYLEPGDEVVLEVERLGKAPDADRPAPRGASQVTATVPAGALTFPALPDGLDTPRIVVDLGRVDANIARLQAEMDARGIAVRPHAKTHKSVAIARRQLAAGAGGITVGTIGEAEVFGAAGIDDLFLAYPVWAGNPSKAARLRAIHESVARFAVGVDSVEGARRLAEAVQGSGGAVAGPRRGRSGQRSDRGADARCGGRRRSCGAGGGSRGRRRLQSRRPRLRPGSGHPAGADEVRTLTAAAAALRDAGIPIEVISAGATPTMLTAAAGSVTEMRAGTYAYGDRQQWLLGTIPADGCAVAVAATVVSVFEDRLVIDAGAKALTKDRAPWLEGHGAIVGYPDQVIERVNDYHGVVAAPPGAARPALGDVVAVIPNHICPVIDLVDTVVAMSPDGSIDEWPVDARGRSG
jgi:D-serine deaminase-like pyridoxal phosphate-dependent protein